MPGSERGAGKGFVECWEGKVDFLVQDIVVTVSVGGTRSSGLAPVVVPQGVGDGSEVRWLELCCLVMGYVELGEQSAETDEVTASVWAVECVAAGECVEELGDGAGSVVGGNPVADELNLASNLHWRNAGLDADVRAMGEAIDPQSSAKGLVLKRLKFVEN